MFPIAKGAIFVHFLLSHSQVATFCRPEAFSLFREARLLERTRSAPYAPAKRYARRPYAKRTCSSTPARQCLARPLWNDGVGKVLGRFDGGCVKCGHFRGKEFARGGGGFWCFNFWVPFHYSENQKITTLLEHLSFGHWGF